MIYMDNAATTWPKPAGVGEAMQRAIAEWGGNPGRGGHRMAREAGKRVEETRFRLATLFHAPSPKDIWFCPSATYGINQVLKGWLRPGDHVVTTGWEHHAVARPLHYLQQSRGIKVSVIPATPERGIDLAELKKTVTTKTRLIALTHASNIMCYVLPIQEIAEIGRENGIPLLVDAAQSAGLLPINVQKLGIHFLSFPGHKNLFGPQGVGGLYVNPTIELEPFLHGGTGVMSAQMAPLVERPLSYESGTLNTPGIIGWNEGLRFIENFGIGAIHQQEMKTVNRVAEALQSIPGVTLYTPTSLQLPVLSLNIAGMDSNEVATLLDQHYDIAVRGGYHCAIQAHQTLGTSQGGTVRVSPGYFTTEEEVATFIGAIEELSVAFS